jgi:uncharacterized glyoxalase superfamily protein PhnB
MRNRSAPGADVVPILIYSDVAKAVDWLCAAFGFDERLRAPDRDGVVNHAQLTVGDGAIMVGRSRGPLEPLQARDVRQYVLVEVPDADAHCERAKRHGAAILQAPTDMPFGARQYTASDLEGHWWTFSQNVADVEPSAWGAIEKAHLRQS